MQVVLGMAEAFVGSKLLDGEFHTMLGLPDIISRILEAFLGAVLILFIVGSVKSFQGEK